MIKEFVERKRKLVNTALYGGTQAGKSNANINFIVKCIFFPSWQKQVKNKLKK